MRRNMRPKATNRPKTKKRASYIYKNNSYIIDYYSVVYFGRLWSELKKRLFFIGRLWSKKTAHLDVKCAIPNKKQHFGRFSASSNLAILLCFNILAKYKRLHWSIGRFFEKMHQIFYTIKCVKYTYYCVFMLYKFDNQIINCYFYTINC